MRHLAKFICYSYIFRYYSTCAPPPQDARGIFCTIYPRAAIQMAPPSLCKRLDVLVSKVGQAAEKFFRKIFPVSALRPLKEVSYFCCFAKRGKSSFCQDPISNFSCFSCTPTDGRKKNLAPILEIGANRQEGRFCYLLFKKTGVH